MEKTYNYTFEYNGNYITTYYGISHENMQYIAQGMCHGMRTAGRKRPQIHVYEIHEDGERTLVNIQR